MFDLDRDALDRWITTDPRDAQDAEFERWLEANPEVAADTEEETLAAWSLFEASLEDAERDALESRAEALRDDALADWGW